MQNNKDSARDYQRETAEYLARIRRTIADSRAMVAQMELRFAETDRLLASQGLTREQVAAFRFTPEQRRAVNAELARRGLPPIEDLEPAPGDGTDASPAVSPAPPPVRDTSGDMENRRQKFGLMMKPFQL